MRKPKHSKPIKHQKIMERFKLPLRSLTTLLTAILVMAASSTFAQVNADFVASDTSGCAPHTVQFTDLTTGGNPQEYEVTWIFGDGDTSQASNPTHVYQSSGTYDVTLIVDTITSDQETKTDYITVTSPANPMSVSLDTVKPVSCHGNQDGKIVANAQGGTPAYDWRVNGQNISGNDTAGLGQGYYHVQVEDADGCTASEDTTIEEPPELVLDTVIVTDATCSTCFDGAIDIEVSGGTPPYSYYWSTGDTTQDLANISLGSYWSVTVTDNNGCDLVKQNIKVGLNCPLSVSGTVTDYQCASSPGAINTSVSHNAGSVTFNWSNGDTTQHLSGLSPGNYNLIAEDTTGCTKTDTFTVKDVSADISIYPDSCGPLTLQVPGNIIPDTIVWSNGVTDSSQIPVNSTGTYSVTVTDQNGCALTDTIVVDSAMYNTVLNNCVWPGDANSDGIANNNDLLNIGVAHGSSGPARLNSSIVWEGVYASNWSSTFNSGLNYKHADCNGDGTINDQDTMAITQNYGQTHNKMAGNNDSKGVPVSVDIPPDTINEGATIQVPVSVGSSQSPVNDLHGLAFSVQYNSDVVEQNSLQFTPSNSWMGTPSSDLLTIDKELPSSSQIDIGLTRTNQQNKSGNGIVGYVEVGMKDDIAGKEFGGDSLLMLQVTNIKGISADESPVAFYGEADSAKVYNKVTDVKPDDDFSSVSVYPNPVREDGIMIDGIDDLTINQVRLINVLGEVEKTIRPEDRVSSLRVPTGQLSEGLYYLQISTPDGSMNKPLSIVR